KEDNYLLDTHTAVAVVAAEKYETDNKKVILSTASPYKFSKDVYRCITKETIEDNLFAMDKLYELTKMEIPNSLNELKTKEVRFKEVIENNDKQTIINKLKEA
ncbi:MAG: threonine synthase, partial [Erysipelotrichaceae bacterium]|nr:threonine synthase [Erysipelotrichaceae bacterium]